MPAMGKGRSQTVASNYVLGKRLRRACNRRWLPEELDVIRTAIEADMTLDETHALLPHRSRDSVKDRFYRAREKQDRDEPASLADAHRKKDGEEGCRMLLEALIRAGFVPAELVRMRA